MKYRESLEIDPQKIGGWFSRHKIGQPLPQKGSFMAGFVVPQLSAVAYSTSLPIQEESHCDTGTTAHLFQIERAYLRRLAIVRCLIRLGLDWAEADDVTQEAFLRAVNFAQNGKAPRYLFQWLLASARNIALNRLRHQKYETLAPADLWKRWETELADKADSADTDMLRNERHGRFIEAVSTLSAVEQQCVLLRFKAARFHEIADTLRIPMHSAVYYSGTGMRKLQRKLKRPRRSFQRT